jgi:hypothetical protein
MYPFCAEMRLFQPTERHLLQNNYAHLHFVTEILNVILITKARAKELMFCGRSLHVEAR